MRLVVWVCIKGFTLTYLSPLCKAVVSARVLKGGNAKLLKHRSVKLWNDVETRGMMCAGIATLKFTFRSEGRKCLYVVDVGGE